MDAWKICFVVLAAVCISCEGTSSRKKDLPAGERIGHLRSLLMSAVRGGSDWVRLTSPLLDAEMNPDGSSSVQVGDGSVAKFDTDASGKRKGRVGSDGSVMEGEGQIGGQSSVKVGGGSAATVETEEDGSAKAVVGSGSNATVAEVGANGDVKVKGSSVDVEIDGTEDGQVDPVVEGASTVNNENPKEATVLKGNTEYPDATAEFSEDAKPGSEGHESSSQALPRTIVDHAPSGAFGWLRNAFMTATLRPQVVSQKPPQGNTPDQVAQGINSGNGVSAPDTYYSRARQAIQETGVTDLPEPGNGFSAQPTTPLSLQGAVTGEAAVAAFG